MKQLKQNPNPGQPPMPDKRPPEYEEALEQFVLLWGEMASAWGINKTMSQIHALLYAGSHPLDTDAIMDRLDISRGNANMNVHKLLQWGLIKKENFAGDRRDYYSAEQDVWRVVSIIIKERQQREIEPITEQLQQCLQTLDRAEKTREIEEFKKRIENYLEFLQMFERFTEALLPFISKRSLSFLKQLVKLVEVQEKLFSGSKSSKELSKK